MENTRKILEPTDENFMIAADCVKCGGVIITPSDTNIALTLNPWIDSAIKRTFEIKGRPATSPLTLFIDNPDEWCEYANTFDKELVKELVHAFWPGPLNIILEKKDTVSDVMVCYGSTVSIGCLSNPVWRGFMHQLRMPVAMTSANLSGKADGILVDLELALEQVGDKVDYILKGDSNGTTCSSTIIDLSREPRLLRVGDISKEEIEAVIGKKIVTN